MNGNRRWPGFLSAFLAVALPGAAVGLTLLLKNFVSTAGYIFFYVAVIVSAWYGGKWAGAASVVFGALAVAYFLTPPLHSFAVDRQSLPLFVEFAASAVIVGWFSSWRKAIEGELQRARDELQVRVEERTADLRRTNEQLVAEMAERKRAEDAYHETRAELSRMNRMSAMGALAASISHEINQPLAAVVTNADACSIWLSANPPNLEETRAAVDRIAREGTRASDIVRRIRAMFTKGAPQRSNLQVNGLIRDAAALLATEISRHHVILESQLGADLRVVAGDRVQLQQVLVNLAMNAIEAMSAVTGRPAILLMRSEMQGADHVLVSVRDSGVGMDPNNHRRMFDAFFTTKSQGMGMGLSISRSIIEAHGGQLWAVSNADYGTTMQFTLPVARQDAW
jgi:C4-dicarboxylate-specific signal transduction histidine kinase